MSVTAGDYPEKPYDDRVIEGVFDSPGNTTDTQTEGESPNKGAENEATNKRVVDAPASTTPPPSVCVTGLRGLVEKATPGPWRHVPESDHFIVFASPSAAIHAAAYAETKDNARLIALAPDLALWAADAADALHAFLGHGPAAEPTYDEVEALLARFAVIQNRAQEEDAA